MLKLLAGMYVILGIMFIAPEVNAVEKRIDGDTARFLMSAAPGVVKSMSLVAMDEHMSIGNSPMAARIASELRIRKDPESKGIILKALERQESSYTRMVLAQALYALDKENGKVYLQQLLSDSRISVSTAAAAVLAVEDKAAFNQVQLALDSDEHYIRLDAAREVLMSVTTAPVLFEKASSIILEKVGQAGQYNEISLLTVQQRPEAVEWMRPFTFEPYDEKTRRDAIRAISFFKDSTLVLPVLVPLIDDPSEAVAKDAIGHIAFRADRSDWHITPFANSITLEEARRQIKQWWAEESAKAQNPDSVQ